MVDKRAQMKIQQMAFMLIALFIFFTLVGLFFINIAFKDIQKSAGNLQKDASISSLGVIMNMPELHCDEKKSLCIDKDKVRVLVENASVYDSFWPVASLAVYVVYPEPEALITCPGVDCNVYEIYDNGQVNKQEVASYVSLCEKVNEVNYVYDKCEIAKLVVGVEIKDG